MKPTNFRALDNGFSLVEMAVVLAIVGVLLGVGFSTVGAYLDNAKQNHTQNSLEVTKQALLNFVTVNKHLPCPDTDDNGFENRTSGRCTAYLGAIPYADLGLGRALASDDWGNLFGYGVHQQAINASGIASSGSAGSYFNNQNAPVFTLNTPPTAVAADVTAESYTVCKRTAADDCSGTKDKEVEFIPAVIVAYNENGGVTTLTSCGSGARSARETENCNANMTLIKGVFNKDTFDDQMVVISAYEIKERALDINSTTAMTLNINTGEYDGYDVIIKGDVDNANATNLGTSADESFYIDTSDGDSTTGGNLNAQVTLKDGNDKLYITKDILAGGNADMGSGADYLFVGGNISGGGKADLGDGDDTFLIEGSVLYKGSIDLGKGADVGTVNGSVGGSLLGDTGNDQVTIKGDVTGTVNMGADNDTLYVLGDLVGGTLDGGTGTDTLYLSSTEAEVLELKGTVKNFETIVYGYQP